MNRLLLSILCISILASCSNADSAEESTQNTSTENKNESERQDGFNPIQKKVEFQAIDGLKVTADVYEIDSISPWLILCHQAGFSRGEYINTAKRLNEKGFNCIAIDQRSGEIANTIVNETAKRAKDEGLETSYLEAEKDIISAVQFVKILTESRDQELILVGSSYSATLVLKIASNKAEELGISGVAAFSPGEYIKGFSLAETVVPLSIPTFVTAAKSEIEAVQEITANVDKTHLSLFIPEEEGIHGSRALWEETPNHKEYREAFQGFLMGFKN